MKKLLAVCVLAAPMFAATGGAMSDAERAFLIDQLEQSKKNMLASISGLSEAQWRFKPAPNVWSVAECAEHIILSEDFLFKSAQQILQSPAVERPQTSNAEQDRKLVTMIEDRSHKATAPEPITPSGKFATPADAAREFTARRDRTLAYVRSTNDDLRTHISKDSPAGTMDAYQFLLLLAAHSARHTAQIREVQSNPEYPKSSAKAQFLVIYTLAGGSLDKLPAGQLAKLKEHAAYIQSQAKAGRVTWAGRITDPKRPQGFALVEAATEDEAHAYVNNDPAFKAGVFQCTIEPFMEAFRASKY